MASQDTPESAKHLPLEAASISRSSPAEQIAVLDILFEPSQSLHELGLPLLQTPFNSYRELIDCVRAELRQLAERASSNDTDRKILYDILGSHPRLGAPKSSHLSEFSRREQANLATAAAAATSPGQGAEDEADRLRKLNEEYERTFPGLRYVVFVCGRGRDVIMEDMRRRIDAADVSSEIDTTITVSLLSCPGSVDLQSPSDCRAK
ncbi:putative allantoinase 1 [Trichophyton interdigitale]|uniref:Allantoinase 1 n=1 Tax=Trichophyton interdigitale TaxID=101480 RepID=A0A9P4YKA4_9EURO|nr:putative allantoinase 1 [Trichophyton interdigitale]KAF3899804.1 putative allantoinase 1 [Trichophyton interdigitale]KAG8207722.1 putative allantoinase 1 [Trichophyton interdigitale]